MMHLLHPSKSASVQDLDDVPAALAALKSELAEVLLSCGLPASAAIPPAIGGAESGCSADVVAGYPVRVCTHYSHYSFTWIVSVDAILRTELPSRA